MGGLTTIHVDSQVVCKANRRAPISSMVYDGTSLSVEWLTCRVRTMRAASRKITQKVSLFLSFLRDRRVPRRLPSETAQLVLLHQRLLAPCSLDVHVAPAVLHKGPEGSNHQIANSPIYIKPSSRSEFAGTCLGDDRWPYCLNTIVALDSRTASWQPSQESLQGEVTFSCLADDSIHTLSQPASQIVRYLLFNLR